MDSLKIFSMFDGVGGFIVGLNNANKDFFQTTYSSFETGARCPTTHKLLYIVNFYNASMDYVVGRTDRKKIYKRNLSR